MNRPTALDTDAMVRDFSTYHEHRRSSTHRRLFRDLAGLVLNASSFVNSHPAFDAQAAAALHHPRRLSRISREPCTDDPGMAASQRACATTPD